MNWLSHTSVADRQTLVVNAPEKEALLDDLEGRMRTGKGFSVATLNLDHLVKLRQSPAFRDAYVACTHVTADGNPIVWLSRLSGTQVSLVPGSELVVPVIERALAADVPIGLFGSSQASLDEAAETLRARYPALKIGLTLSPAMGFDPDGAEADAAIQAMADADIRLCLVGLGAPRQELFAARAQTQLPKCGFLCIGAGIDFISGRQKRAPGFARRFALEWLWRMLSDPVRLTGRYVRCAALLPGLAYRALKTRLSA